MRTHHEIQRLVSSIVRQEDPHATELGHSVAAARAKAAGGRRLEAGAVQQRPEGTAGVRGFGAAAHETTRQEVADVVRILPTVEDRVAGCVAVRLGVAARVGGDVLGPAGT